MNIYHKLKLYTKATITGGKIVSVWFCSTAFTKDDGTFGETNKNTCIMFTNTILIHYYLPRW